MTENPFFPFHKLGYRCNPFRVLTADEWADLAVIPESVWKAVNEGRHIQVIGKKGRGKSTILRGLAEHFRDQGLRAAYEHIPEGQHHFLTKVSSLDVLLLDEVQRLNLSERIRLFRAGSRVRLIIGSHWDHRAGFFISGQKLRTLSANTSSPEHIRQMIETRLAFFALDTDGVQFVPEDGIEYQLYARFGSDHRVIEEELYRYFQNLA